MSDELVWRAMKGDQLANLQLWEDDMRERGGSSNSRCANAFQSARETIEAQAAEIEELKALLEAASESLHYLVGETLGGDGAVERGEVAPRGSYNAWISWNERWAARKCCRSIDAVLTR